MSRPRTRSDADVLDATERVLHRRGPHAFTLADVAAEVGLAPATLIQRFRTKRGLLVALARRAAAETPVIAPGIAGVRRALRAHARAMATRTRLVNGMALLLEDIRTAPLRAAARRHAEGMERAIAAALASEVDDPRAVAHVLWAVYNGALVQWALRGKGRVEDWVSRAIDLALAPRR